MTHLKQGLVQVYTGKGKGKTTAALGLALRAIGHGFSVFLVQFMKGTPVYGELAALQRLQPSIQFAQYGRDCFEGKYHEDGSPVIDYDKCMIRKGEATEEDRQMAQAALHKAREVLCSGEYDIVILDELTNAIYFELVTLEEALELIQLRPEQVELVITGRNAPPEIIEKASLVTEATEVKHPYQEGMLGRQGIEY
ncbi:cob(I)yrinic acid a,c-diamide adenosyltransferase [Heliobacterium gestii]|uniref:Cob(I)yrinic acid a,c-diamide adenosyltransferase n=1 Tax=Heliomicrobium gestii TaxID=2699 RepID=A0A845LNA4_HELGE|nr:cob(I)yrinic acid a,c-diamide adenosyltransferase [Heliomicrobium gestii]MBM7868106.1 cob(I)alamin adenosyltransferase [Heliomicrobium gestii]MZP44366.1 cob(I)yrinic acid a,c-diamide adenosyltransferase [Heliomicrobium gestii]